MIICAAIKQDNAVYQLPKPARHHDIIRYMVEIAGLPKPITGEWGFIDDVEGFVDRITASRLAVEAGQVHEIQVTRLDGYRGLYSEDLW